MVRVRLTWSDGDTRIVDISPEAIAFYVNQGVNVQPIAPPVGTGRRQGRVILNDGFVVNFVLTDSNLTILGSPTRKAQLEIRQILIDNPNSELGTGSVQAVIRAIEDHLMSTPDPFPPIPPTQPPDDMPPDEERNLFNTAIVGAIGIGILASLMGGKKK